MSIPADAENFLRRECPTCEQQFKWHLGPINDDAAAAPPPSKHYCPLCGQPALPDQWWTREQIAYAQARVMPGILEQLANKAGLQIDAPPTTPNPKVPGWYEFFKPTMTARRMSCSPTPPTPGSSTPSTTLSRNSRRAETRSWPTRTSATSAAPKDRPSLALTVEVLDDAPRNWGRLR